MKNWTITTNMDEATIQKETEELGSEFNHLKDIVFNILDKLAIPLS